MELEVLVPVSPPSVLEHPLAPRLDGLTGRRVGLLSNGKANAAELLEGVGSGLSRRFPRLELTREVKPQGATVGAPHDVMGRLQECDAVILAIADWGSCTSWSVHDSVELERAGTPTALICSDEFGPLGRAEAECLGYGGLPLIPVPHPLAGNHAELVAAKAQGVVDELVDALTADAEAVAARHRERFGRLTQRRLGHGAVCVDEVCAVDLALLRRP